MKTLTLSSILLASLLLSGCGNSGTTSTLTDIAQTNTNTSGNSGGSDNFGNPVSFSSIPNGLNIDCQTLGGTEDDVVRLTFNDVEGAKQFIMQTGKEIPEFDAQNFFIAYEYSYENNSILLQLPADIREDSDGEYGRPSFNITSNSGKFIAGENINIDTFTCKVIHILDLSNLGF